MNHCDSPNPCALSIVVPCFNEEEVLATLCRRVRDAAQGCVGPDYEIVLVNDGSTDATLAVMHGLAAQHPELVVVNLSRNYGHQIALSAGLAHAGGARVLIIDADLQDPPELLGEMMRLMDLGHDVVYGQRSARNGESAFKRVTSSLFYKAIGRLSNTPIPENTGDFRLMNRRTVDLINAMPEQCRFLRGMISWIGLSQAPLLYERQARLAGKTKYPLTKMLRLAFDAVTGFSVAPLRLASLTGALFGVVGLALLLYVFRAWLAGEVVQGWTSMMVVVLVIGSVQLLCLGVFGEYLGRLYLESKSRPLYIVESVLRGTNKIETFPTRSSHA